MCDIHYTEHIVAPCHDGLICRQCYVDYLKKNIRMQCDNCNLVICGIKCKASIIRSPVKSIHQGKHVLVCPRCINRLQQMERGITDNKQ